MSPDSNLTMHDSPRSVATLARMYLDFDTYLQLHDCRKQGVDPLRICPRLAEVEANLKSQSWVRDCAPP